MSNLVRCDVNLGLIANNNSRGGESKQRVLHTAEWEGWWQHNNSIVTPDVVGQVFLSGVEQSLEGLQLVGNEVHLRRLGDDSDSTAQRTVLKISNNDRHQVRRNLDVTLEVGHSVRRVVFVVNEGLIRGHLNHKLVFGQDLGRVGCLDCWGVLHRSDAAAVDGLALREQIGQFFASSLRRGHPAQGHGILSSFEVDSDVESLVRHHNSWQLDGKLLANHRVLVEDLELQLVANIVGLLPVAHVHAVDSLAPDIEDDLVSEADDLHSVSDVTGDGLIIKVDCSA